jgi:hypothetical protein
MKEPKKIAVPMMETHTEGGIVVHQPLCKDARVLAAWLAGIEKQDLRNSSDHFLVHVPDGRWSLAAKAREISC